EGARGQEDRREEDAGQESRPQVGLTCRCGLAPPCTCGVRGRCSYHGGVQQVYGLTGWIMAALWLLAISATVFALVHAVRQRSDAFTAVDKLTKPIWLGILG